MTPPLLSAPLGLVTTGSSRRPRAFGRTSNVWQYVEAVQVRTTPALKYREPPIEGESESEGEEEEDDDDGRGDGDHPTALGGEALHPRVRTEVRKSSHTGKLDFKTHPGARVGSVDPSPHRRSSHEIRTSTNLLELPPVATAAAIGKKASAASTVYASPTPSRKFNANDIVKRIQALGTSASAPQLMLPPPTTAAMTTTANNQPMAGPLPVAATATAPVVLSDADRLRNDFNSQRGKLYFGCSVAFELFNGHLLMVRSPDGAVGVQPLDHLQLKTGTSSGSTASGSGRDRAVFTLVDLTDVRSASAIRFGDAVWLQLSVGAGDASWEQGGVLGAKVREAPQLEALARDDNAHVRNDTPAPLVIGHPVPVRAYLPKNRDDVDAQVDEIQSRVRNKSSKMLGKWILRSALQRVGDRRRRLTDEFVYNTDEIYLEQDWFYLGADSDNGVAVLRQLPPASALKDVPLGEYVVERRGAWKLRVLDSSNGSGGLSLAQQQMEKLLLRAKTQLKQSRKMRAGQTRQYGGAAFVSTLRKQLAETTRDCDAQYAATQERRLSRLPQHLSSRADTLQSEDEGQEDEEEEEEEETVRRKSSANTRLLSSAALLSVSSRATSASPNKSIGITSRSETVCALCQSSSVGYNLCCQIHSVMNTLHAEREQANAALATAKVSAQSQRLHTSSSVTTSNGSDTGSVTASLSLVSPGMLINKPSSRGAAPQTKTLAAGASQPPTALLTGSGGASRLLELFSQQDQQLLNVIKCKEKTLEHQRATEIHLQNGLSSVASHFRDRFKHVDQLVQQHADDIGHHGIGGHFQRLHDELQRDAIMKRESHQRSHKPQRTKAYLQRLREQHLQATAQDADQDEEQSELGDEQDDRFVDVLSLIDTTTQCPVVFPDDGYDVYGNPQGLVALNSAQRLFPTPDEMDKLPPVDTKLALTLYLQNHQAVVEMLDGFVELTATHIRPNLANAMDARNRGALVEFLDFAARAAEFVCARRVQVRVAQLLHAVAATGVGDFEAFANEYDLLLQELDATVAFVMFYRDRVGNPKPKKPKKGGKN